MFQCSMHQGATIFLFTSGQLQPLAFALSKAPKVPTSAADSHLGPETIDDYFEARQRETLFQAWACRAPMEAPDSGPVAPPLRGLQRSELRGLRSTEGAWGPKGRPRSGLRRIVGRLRLVWASSGPCCGRRMPGSTGLPWEPSCRLGRGPFAAKVLTGS